MVPSSPLNALKYKSQKVYKQILLHLPHPFAFLYFAPFFVYLCLILLIENCLLLLYPYLLFSLKVYSCFHLKDGRDVIDLFISRGRQVNLQQNVGFETKVMYVLRKAVREYKEANVNVICKCRRYCLNVTSYV